MYAGRLSRTLIYRPHNSAIEALLLLAEFRETIERANGFVAACTLFANSSRMGNYRLARGACFDGSAISNQRSAKFEFVAYCSQRLNFSV